MIQEREATFIKRKRNTFDAEIKKKRALTLEVVEVGPLQEFLWCFLQVLQNDE